MRDNLKRIVMTHTTSKVDSNFYCVLKIRVVTIHFHYQLLEGVIEFMTSRNHDDSFNLSLRVFAVRLFAICLSASDLNRNSLQDQWSVFILLIDLLTSVSVLFVTTFRIKFKLKLNK